MCDVDSQCKAIGYMNDISGVSCGLSESDHVTATACPSCHVFTKNCSADCVTYTVFSGGFIGRTQYANYDPSSYTECQDRCTNDPFCNGFIHNDVIMTCRLPESRKEVASPGNASFSFSRKECSSGCANYLAYGVKYIIEFSALYSLNSPVTKRACEALCTADPGCRGAAYQTSDQNCGLFDSGTSQEYSGCLACTAFAKQCPTDSTVPKYLACAECSFSARDCDVDVPSKYFVQCLTNFCSVGVNLTVSMESSNHDSSDFATCQDLCANDPLCLSFHHSQGDSAVCLRQTNLPLDVTLVNHTPNTAYQDATQCRT
nr:uncharacterized protein LOC105329849 [Crassostrea gigas]XP_034335385.1 uncharacterized protein LOC105329849 [Crassostrea gigas]